MADSKADARRNSHKASLAFTDAQLAGSTNPDLERRIRGVALGLSGTALVSKSINDLRILSGARADDA